MSEIPSADFNLEFVQAGVKATIADVDAKSRDLWMVPIDRLTIVAGLNVRIHDAEYESHVEEIKNSIITNGFYQHMPLPGYAAKEGDANLIYLTGGFTRLEAAKRAIQEGMAIEALPVILKPAGTSMLDLTYALDGDNTGNPLRPYERAIVVKRAINMGDSEETIARRMNISMQYVKRLLFLMSLPNALQAQVINGRAAAGTVIDLALKVGAAEALKAFEQRAEGGFDVDGWSTTLPASTPAERVTPRAAASRAREATGKVIIAKKTLFNAIDYAIALPTGGIEWLGRWRDVDKDAVAELASYKPPRKNAKKPKAVKAKGGKRGRPAKGKGNSEASHDPFDTGEEAPL